MDSYFIINGKKSNNVITYVGLDDMFRKLCTDADIPAFEYLAIGIGKTSESKEDSFLEYEVFRKKAEFRSSFGIPTFTISTVFAPGEGTGLISEVGVFNSKFQGTLLARSATFGIHFKSSKDPLAVVWKFRSD